MRNWPALQLRNATPVYEIELKFALADVSQVVDRLTRAHALPGKTIEQCDTYFRHPARDFAATNEALRLRSVGSENWWTYKGPVLDRQVKTRREIETRLGDGAQVASQFAETLQLLGFAAVRVVRKRRTAYHLERAGRAFEIAVDEVHELGAYLEVETLADETERASAQQALLDLAAELRLPASEKRSYLELLLEKDRQKS